MSRRLAPLLVLIAGCTASWGSVVRYSAEPARPQERLELDIYAALLEEYGAGRQTALVLDESVSVLERSRRQVARAHWADTLKREVFAAASDSARLRPAVLADLELAAHLAGVPAEPPPMNQDARPRPRLSVWRPGFNRDSTIAAVDVVFYCGGRCGHSATVLLARMPGRRWRVWHTSVRWVS
jgi:hypothetical protein